MDEMREKVETWRKLIQSEKLRDALEDIQVCFSSFNLSYL